jgi:hypothetical protein
MGKDAPDWSDTIYQIQQPSPSYPHGVWEIEGVEQVFAALAFTGTTETLWTVPADKVGYLTTLHLEVANTSSSTWYGRVKIYDADGNTKQTWYIYVTRYVSVAESMCFPVPLRLLEGWYLQVTSPNGDVWVTASITGYTLPSS